MQNSLDELYHLLLFLDPERVKKECSVEGTTAIAALDQVFSSNEEDEATQKRLANLRELLQGRMLRRLKDDVLKGVIKAKKELVVRVELTPTQKKLYRAVLTANFPALSGAEGSKSKARAPALQNIVMQLRKVCNHVELMRDKFPEEMIGADSASSSRRWRQRDVTPPRRRRRGRQRAYASRESRLATASVPRRW